MARITYPPESVQPLAVAVSFSDIVTDVQDLAAHKIAAQFSLPVSIAKVVVHHAGLGGGRQ